MKKFIIVKHFLSSFIFDESLIAEITANENKILKQLKEMHEAQTINTQVLDESIESNTKKIIYYTIGLFAFIGICYLFMYGNDGGEGETFIEKLSVVGADIYSKMDNNNLSLIKTIGELRNTYLRSNVAIDNLVDRMCSINNIQMNQETFNELLAIVASNGKQLATISKMLEILNKNNTNSSSTITSSVVITETVKKAVFSDES